jgi:hypothetical protein
MQRFSETIEISRDADRVWRALSTPSEVVCWDTGILEPLDAPADYPRPGQHVRWRYRLGPIPMLLHDRPSEVVPPTTFRSSIHLGPFDFDETYTLVAKGSSTTELTAELSLTTGVALVGGWIERVIGRPLARATVRTSLAAIKRHCEER